MTRFPPIAIVGASCILPGALSPAALWRNVLEGRNLITAPPPGYWGIDPKAAVGGYVRGFEAPEQNLDPLFHWVHAGARDALRNAGLSGTTARAGLVLGNLGYPSRSMAHLAEALWLGLDPPDARNRFHFALPAQLAAKELRLSLGGYSIDAACASSLYAIKLACDRLHDGEADIMVAGGSNRADDLFLHAGFTALGALSPTGRSRPFHRDADGLVPAEGAAFVVLERLDDAIARGAEILGVIRGIGCSNDGRGAGLLTPHRDGQVRALRAAYEISGIDPERVSYVECHATGTPVGDATEIASMQEIFHANAGMPIGSLKANLGHLITASGAAGLVKLLQALRAKVLPPTPSCDKPSEALANSRYRLLSEPAPWESSTPRIAGLSAFGFGGNNAHLILEEWTGRTEDKTCLLPAQAPRKIAITGIGVIAGEGESTADFIRALATGENPGRAAKTVSLPLEGVRFPPRDLEQALPQQLMLLRAAQEAMSEAGALPTGRTAVFTGMEVDPEITRHGVRWRFEELLLESGLDPDPAWLEKTRDRIAPPLDGPASVLGNMPNMPANRLNSQFDLRASGFSVGAGERSGEAALDLALRALHRGEIDAAVVCAVDLSCNPVHQHAIGAEKQTGDAAVALVLQPLDAGGPVHAVIDRTETDSPRDTRLDAQFGESFAASGLLHIAATAIEASRRSRDNRPLLPSRTGLTLTSGGYELAAVLETPPAVHTKATKNSGDVALVFTGSAAAYHGAGRDLLTALPILIDRVASRFSGLDEIAGWLYRGESRAALTPLEQLYGSSFLSQVHAELTLGLLELRPAAVIGLSSGETNSLFAAGVWRDIEGMLREIAASGMYEREIAGDFGIARRSWKLRENEPLDWINVRVLAEADAIRAALEHENRAQLLIIHAPGDCLIGGDAESCRRVIRRLGSPAAYEMPGLAVHCPEMREFEDKWCAIHSRPVFPADGIRVYANATNRAYVPDEHSCADMLTTQARETVDLPATILQAWEDGIRVFIEHGPRSLCTGWISKTLGDRPHLAVALDRFGVSSLDQAKETVSALRDAGVEMNYGAFFAPTPQRAPVGRSISVPAHSPFSIEIPVQKMAPAPALPPVIEPERMAVTVSRGGGLHGIVRAIGEAHREAVTAHVEVLRRSADARIAAFRAPARKKPAFSREQLITHASGQISSIFGPLFTKQDGFRRQVRMPEPPLLFADRVTGITGEPGSMQTGSVWTETDVTGASWFLHENRVTPGVLIEAGQADLFLISWLGVDFLNRDERVYRMLSCELTFHGGLPRAGDTLAYDIHIDRHASLADVRLFFFHFDCRVNGQVRLSMRNGQAGFFSDRELADPTGIIRDPEARGEFGAASYPASPASRYSREQVRAFAEGSAFDCFGAGYDLLATHTATPRIPDGRLQLIQEIEKLDMRRGYMRVANEISPEDWFFAGHFKNDPCMPGTLMAEAGMQAIAFYMAALGLTLNRDGWRFEPVEDAVFKLRCRGQVTPASRRLTYEIFVHDVIDGPEPVVYADILGTIDGVTKAVHGQMLGLRLAPDWPLEKAPGRFAAPEVARRGAVVNGFEFGHKSMLASAIGRPSDAFGAMYKRFDGPSRTVRLPGPPYLMMSRVTRVSGEPESMRAGIECEAEFDVDPNAWYFEDNAARVMPVSVLMEAALQPCGWLASFAGCVSTCAEELYFRNLDGTATMHAAVAPDAGILSTRARLTSLSQSGGIILVAFDVETRAGEQLVFSMKTGFGFFPKAALESQSGLPVSEEERARLEEPSEFLADARRPGMAQGKLLMLDRVTGWWPKRLRAEKDVDAREWFFKAHFFQDPVMPGSLGIEAMAQLLEFYLLESGLAAKFPDARFEPLALGEEITWKYRGQVLPTAGRVTVEAEIREVIETDTSVTAIAEAWLYVDGMRIYHAKRIAMRAAGGPRAVEIDPDRDAWLRDHCPNYVLPSLPMMDMANRIAEAAANETPGDVVTGIRNLYVRNWAVVDRKRVIRATPSRLEMQRPEDEQFDLIATADVTTGSSYPEPPPELPALRDAIEMEDPYASGALFHGPAFQVLRSMRSAVHGATAILDAGAGNVSPGLLPVALLDGAFHAIPNGDPETIAPEIPAGNLMFPCGLTHLTFHAAAPRSGPVRCEVRFDGFEGRLPAFRIQMIAGGRVWADMRSIHALIPKGPIGRADALARRAFLRDRTAQDSIGLATLDGDTTSVAIEDVRGADWLPGTVAAIYGANGGYEELARVIAIKEHVARRVGTHPSRVSVAEDLRSAWSDVEPLRLWNVSVESDGGRVTVRGQETRLDFGAVLDYWHGAPGERARVVEAMCQRFVRRIRLEDPEAARALHGKPVLYLANHQTLLESVLFVLLAPVVMGAPITALAKMEQKRSELIQTMLRILSGVGDMPKEPILYFEQSDPASLPGLMRRLRAGMVDEGRSALIHVEGARRLSCRQPVTKIGAAVIDLALEAGVAIVPVRFTGGLPIEPAKEKLDLPFGLGKQDYHIGKPIAARELAALPLKERKARVLDAINGAGLPHEAERPIAADEAYRRAMERRAAASGSSLFEAILRDCARA